MVVALCLYVKKKIRKITAISHNNKKVETSQTATIYTTYKIFNITVNVTKKSE